MCLFPFSPAKAQLIVAHRGASHDAPENTLAAFQLAWQQGADGIEGDFYLSKDGHMVCIHDADTKRTAGVARKVAECTLAELKQLDVGSWKGPQWARERIPTLEEVLATVPPDKRIYIELKIGLEIVPPLAKVLGASDIRPEQVVVICFNRQTVAAVKRQLPELKVHWLSGYKESKQPDPTWGAMRPTPPEILDALRKTGADGFGSAAKLDVFNAKAIKTLREGGMKEFHVWTIDDPAVARQYQALGAFGITTNRPAYIREQLAKTATVSEDASPVSGQ